MKVVSILALVLTLTASAAAEDRETRLHRALERVAEAERQLSQAIIEAPEILDAVDAARRNLKEIDSEVASIKQSQSSFTDFLIAAFPWAAPILTGIGGYVGGRRHEDTLQKKRRAPGGGAPSNPFSPAHPIPVEAEMNTASFNRHAGITNA